MSNNFMDDMPKKKAGNARGNGAAADRIEIDGVQKKKKKKKPRKPWT